MASCHKCDRQNRASLEIIKRSPDLFVGKSRFMLTNLLKHCIIVIVSDGL